MAIYESGLFKDFQLKNRHVQIACELHDWFEHDFGSHLTRLQTAI